jgi:hypothetical protein
MQRRHRFPPQTDPTIIDELVAVLAPHPAGLRRWSVMNAIRKQRQSAGRDVPLKMEADIERAFRGSCTAGASRTARFRRPSETAGEVWALNAAFVSNDDAPGETPPTTSMEAAE